MSFFGPPIRNGVPIGLGSSIGFGSAPFTPAELFYAGEQGFWYDPTDIPLAWRRNLLTRTEEFDNAAWSKQANCSVTGVNVGIAPDGTLTADEVTFTATTNDGIFQGFSAVVSTTYTASFWVKGTGGQVVQIGCQPPAGAVFTQVTLDGSWQRVSATATATIAGMLNVSVDLVSGTTPAVVQVWGAQLELGSTASTYQQIVTPEISFLQYQSQPVLYQDSAGTTPVTAVEQAVGLMLDKSKGLVLTQFSSNDNFASGATGWSAQPGWTVTTGSASVNSASAGTTLIRTSAASVSGVTYKVTFTVSSYTSGTLFAVASTAQGAAVTSTGTFTQYVLANGTGGVGIWANSTNTIATITNITVQALPGNHAFQTTSAKRPVLRARYNLLTYSEQFDNAAWTKNAATISANSTAAPDGTLTADKIVENTANAGHFAASSSVTPTAGASYTMLVYLKAAERTFAMLQFDLGGNNTYAIINLTTGVFGTPTGTGGITFTATSAGDGWWRCTAAGAVSTGAAGFLRLYTASNATTFSYLGDGTSGVFAWGADVRPTSQATGLIGPTYQRIAAATDYDVVGFLPYLQFDGVDDALTTNSIDPGAVDKAQVFAGVRRLSDAALQMVAETSTNASGGGAFYLFIPGSANYNVSSSGTGNNVLGFSGFTSPTTTVISLALTTLAANSAAAVSGRFNGVSAVGTDVVSTNSTGNFGTFPLFIGQRNQATLPLNGLIYSLIGRFGSTLSSGQISATEQWVGQRTGVQL